MTFPLECCRGLTSARKVQSTKLIGVVLGFGSELEQHQTLPAPTVLSAEGGVDQHQLRIFCDRKTILHGALLLNLGLPNASVMLTEVPFVT